MKILWVNPSFLDYRIPVYQKLQELTNGNFYLVYSKNRVPLRVINKIEKAIGHNAIGLENEKIFHIGKSGDFSNTGLKIPYQKGLLTAIKSINVDIIIGEGFFQWTPIAVWVAKQKKIPVVIAYEKTAHTERNCSKGRILYRRFIGKFISGFSVNGKLTQEYLLSCGYTQKQIFTGGMAADSEGLARQVKSLSNEEKEKFKDSYKIDPKGISYLYVGRLIELKGVHYLLEAWIKHIQVYPLDHLFIVGDGILYKQFTSQFGQITSIHFAGNVDYDKIYRYYAIANVFIIPTLEDNWSLVVPEAMACKLPIACSIYNGCYPELVHEGENGKLFDPLKGDSIIQTLDYFHHIDLKQFGESSNKIEKNYNPSNAAQKIYNMCKEITTQKSLEY